MLRFEGFTAMNQGSVLEQMHSEAVDGLLNQVDCSATTEEIGRFLNEFRPYLMTIATTELPNALRGKIGESDIVQETILKGFEDYGEFHGTTREELALWLKTILLHITLNWHKAYHTQKRDLTLEVPASNELVSRGQQSPSQVVVTREQLTNLDEALSRLPSVYREVILLRHRENLTFVEIGARIQKSEDAIRKTWIRAIAQLKQELHRHEFPST